MLVSLSQNNKATCAEKSADPFRVSAAFRRRALAAHENDDLPVPEITTKCFRYFVVPLPPAFGPYAVRNAVRAKLSVSCPRRGQPDAANAGAQFRSMHKSSNARAERCRRRFARRFSSVLEATTTGRDSGRLPQVEVLSKSKLRLTVRPGRLSPPTKPHEARIS